MRDERIGPLRMVRLGRSYRAGLHHLGATRANAGSSARLTRASVGDGSLTLSVEAAPPGVQVEIDKVQVQQVLFNLLRNAIEAMQDQPKRELVVATSLVRGGMVEISFADRGPGLVDEVRAKLFQPFVTTKVHGMGVGLSVCRAIVESHGGRLWADDNPSRGTVFRFTVRHAGPDRL
jgi:two-component system, LuxR family, sensor kinase FixL